MPEQRMSAQLARLAKKRGRLPALVTALSLGALLALQQFLSGVTGYLRGLGYLAVSSSESGESGLSGSGLYELTTFEFHPTLDQLLFRILPFVLGAFLALWLIAPISHELGLRFVLTRAVLAAVAAALLVTLFRIVQGLFDSIGVGSPIIGSDPDAPPPPAPEGVNLTVLGQNTLDALVGGANIIVFYTPIVMFAGVLLWLWLREHPREYAVSGLIDEV